MSFLGDVLVIVFIDCFNCFIFLCNFCEGIKRFLIIVYFNMWSMWCYVWKENFIIGFVKYYVIFCVIMYKYFLVGIVKGENISKMI